MSVPKEHIEEYLSMSYVHAVVARAGVSINNIGQDYGVDVSIREIRKMNGNLLDGGPLFDGQLKATINWEDHGETIAYDIKKDAYNKLADRNNSFATPCFLILFCLPKEEDKWLHISENELNLRKCCYYYYIEGEHTNNKSQVRIHIPKTNIFSPSQVKSLIKRINIGEVK